MQERYVGGVPDLNIATDRPRWLTLADMARRDLPAALALGLGLVTALAGCGADSPADDGNAQPQTPGTSSATLPTPSPPPTSASPTTPSTTPSTTAPGPTPPTPLTPRDIAAGLAEVRGRPCRLVRIALPPDQVPAASQTWGCEESTETIAIFATGRRGVTQYLAATTGSGLTTVYGINWVVADQYLAPDAARRLARELRGTVRR